MCLTVYKTQVPAWLQSELVYSAEVEPSDSNEADCTTEHSDNEDPVTSATDDSTANIRINTDLLKSGILTSWSQKLAVIVSLTVIWIIGYSKHFHIKYVGLPGLSCIVYITLLAYIIHYFIKSN